MVLADKSLPLPSSHFLLRSGKCSFILAAKLVLCQWPAVWGQICF